MTLYSLGYNFLPLVDNLILQNIFKYVNTFLFNIV